MKTLVVIHTKDRPDRLAVTLPWLRDERNPAILMDDSLSPYSQRLGRELAQAAGIAYHGAGEQERVLGRWKAAARFMGTRRLSRWKWNLGHNRSYAILLAREMGCEFLWAADDDIVLDIPGVREAMVTACQEHTYSGARICGMPDDSIIGHLHRLAGRRLVELSSGSCFAMSVRRPEHYYMNVYNEDWIWQLMHRRQGGEPQTGEVRQLFYEPFAGWRGRIGFQEFGEVLVEGLLRVERGDWEVLKEPDLWPGILEVRRDRIRALRNERFDAALGKLALAVCERALEVVDRLDPAYCAGAMRAYWRRLSQWRDIVG